MVSGAVGRRRQDEPFARCYHLLGVVAVEPDPATLHFARGAPPTRRPERRGPYGTVYHP